MTQELNTIPGVAWMGKFRTTVVGNIKLEDANTVISPSGVIRLVEHGNPSNSLKPRDTKPPPHKSSRVEKHLKALRNRAAGKRRQAALTLGKLGDARAVGPLIHALQDQAFGVRSCAALSLGLLGDQRAVEPLIKALKDFDYTVREQVALALGLLGDFRAVTPLKNALQDSSQTVRNRVVLALQMLGKYQDQMELS